MSLELEDNTLYLDRDIHIKQESVEIFCMTMPQLETQIEIDNRCLKEEIEDLENNPLNLDSDLHIKEVPVQIFSMAMPQLDLEIKNRCIKKEAQQLEDDPLNSDRYNHIKQDLVQEEEHITEELDLYADYEIKEEDAELRQCVAQTSCVLAACKVNDSTRQIL